MCSVWYLLDVFLLLRLLRRAINRFLGLFVGNMKPVFCGNFEYDARESDLERLFRKYGKVERVDMKAGKSWLLVLGFFITFS